MNPDTPSPGPHVEHARLASFRGHQMRTVRSYVQEVLEEEGFSVTVHPDHLVTQDGRTFGLDSLLARCSKAPEAAWRQIVADQVHALLGACRPDLLDGLDLSRSAGRVYPRLVDRRIIPPEMRDALSYARPVSGDLVEILVLEENLTVLWLRDADVERIGYPVLRAAAEANLLAVRRPRRRTLVLDHGAGVHVLEGGGHTASQVLVLPQLLPDVLGHADVPHGVIVAIPTKYELWLHPIADRFAYAAYFGLYEEAVRAYTRDPGALSPYLYWWVHGDLVQVMTERDGLPYPDDLFIKTIARVAEADDEPAALALPAELGRRR